MTTRLLAFLGGLAKFVAVVALSVALGVGLGTGLSQLSGTEDEAGSSSAVSAATAVSGPSAGGGRSSGDAGRAALQIRVLSSTLTPDTTSTSTGARVVVRLRATARDNDATLGSVRLASGDDERRRASDSSSAAGDLLQRIPARESATGSLIFETAGDFANRLIERRQATLRVGGSSFPLRLTTPNTP